MCILVKTTYKKMCPSVEICIKMLINFHESFFFLITNVLGNMWTLRSDKREICSSLTEWHQVCKGCCKWFMGMNSFSLLPGIACGRPTQSVQEWLEINLGNFSRYAQYQDLLSWNLHFDGVSILYPGSVGMGPIRLFHGNISCKRVK